MATSKHWTIAEKVKERVESLWLTDFGGTVLPVERIDIELGPHVETEELPAVFVCPLGNKSAVGGTNESTDWSYPIMIFVCDRTPVDDPTRVDHALDMREQVQREFEGRRLPGVESVYTCEDLGSPVLAAEFLARYHMLAQPVLLSFVSRELRTPRS